MLDINPGLIIWTVIAFVLVLVVLRSAAWKPLLAALAAREESIRASLRQAEEQSQRVIKEGRDLGERLKAEILEKANASSRDLVAQAKDEIQREKEAALVQLRTEVGELAVAAAGKILDANLDTAKQHALADAAIKELTKGA